MKYYLGYDCGTMGTKVAIFAEDSTLISEAYRSHQIDYPKLGWAEMDADQFYRVTFEGIRECLYKGDIDPHDIRAISCSGVICGIVPIDQNWNAVGPYIPYLDGRSKDIVKRVSETVEPLWKKESGNAVFGAYVPPMILKWLLENDSEMIKKASKVVTGAHYVMGKLGGLCADRAFIDWSHLSGWVIGFDAKKRDWSERQIELLEIPYEILPEVKQPWDIVGTLTREQAEQLGLVEGIPLVAGGGDMQQSCIGSGVVEPGVCSDVAGTASNFNYSVTQPIEEITEQRVLMTAMHTLGDQYLYWCVIPGGGLSLRWFRDNIVSQKNEEGFYESMNHLSEDVSPGSDFLLFFPFLQGRTAPVWPNASASWINLYGSSSNATLWRSMLESISFEYLSWVNILRRVGVKPKRIIGQGGGSKSKLWNQIKADMLNIPYCTIQNSEQAVLGNAILAAYGVGDIKDIKATVGEWVRIKETFYPHPEKNKFYGKIYEYREKILNGPMHEIYEILVELKELKVPQTKSEKNV